MLRYEIPVLSPADELLFEGLPRLQPVLEELGNGALLIGGLASAAWLAARPVGLPVRATRDIDLGIDQTALGIRADRAVVRPLLESHGFHPGFANESFRFADGSSDTPLVVDILVAKGSSRHIPPRAEPGLESIAAPGLRYALDRGPVPLTLALNRLGEMREINLYTSQLDAAFVMKATLVDSGVRTRPDKLTTDTADAVMLAAACMQDAEAMAALASARKRSEPRRALRWLREAFLCPQSAAPRRVGKHVGDDSGARWACEIAESFGKRLP